MTDTVADAGSRDARRWVAILGGARVFSAEQASAAAAIGRGLAAQGCDVVTGATTGLPERCAREARKHGSLVVGVSPALSEDEHVAGGRPADGHDLIIYSGMGPDGRSPLILRSAAAAIFIGGEMGTLLEFCSAWITGGRVLGVLDDGFGVSAMLPSVLANVSTEWGSVVIRSPDPDELVREVVTRTWPSIHAKSGSSGE